LLYTQTERPLRLKTPLGDDVLLLESFQGYERLSTPFRFVLRALSDQPNIALQDMLSKPAVTTIRLPDESERHVHGHVSRIAQLEIGEDGLIAYEIEVVPWLWFLSLFADCRIFQNKSVPEIVEQIFRNRGFSDYKLQLQGSYAKRDYCVQYRETDLNFISRLLEDEGIFYFFEQSEQKHTLVLADSPSAFAPCPTQASARYLSSAGAVLEDDTVHHLRLQQRIHTGSVALNDYDFEKPNTGLHAMLAGTLKGQAYDYPGKYRTKNDGDRYARIRLEEQEVHFATIFGESNCRGFQCGYRFQLTEHFRSDANKAYTIVALEHTARNTSYRATNPDPFEYENRFEAIPSSVPFRPPRLTRKPVVEGAQTAVVVGKSGEEIWTDKYGRIKVQFYWDREGKRDENSSCWIRVAQGWAGKNWGSVFTPRIGQEVIVDFLEGDPDQPIIVGSVYNAEHMPPYTLPDEQTKSAIKTMSSKGGGGFNEIRFEDKKDSEQIFIHGQKDLDVRIEKDSKEWIGQDRHLIVARDRFEEVRRDTHATITRDQIEKVGRDHHLDIAGKEAVKIAGSQSLTVQGNVIEEFKSSHSSQVSQDLYLKAMNVVIEASATLTIKVGGNFININSGGVFIKGNMVMINSGGMAGSGTAAAILSPLSPTAPKEADVARAGGTQVSGAETRTPASLSLQTITPAKVVRQSAAADAPTHDPSAEENRQKTSWIEIKLVGEDGKPIPGEAYRVTLPDGKVADGTLDENGFARVSGFDPGSCKISFPNLDQDAWEPA